MSATAIETRTKTNNYARNGHVDSIFKSKARAAIRGEALMKFPFAGKPTLHTVTLGGEDLKLEHDLNMFYKVSGVSYEFNAESAKKARKNAPNGVRIIKDNMFTHKYTGEQIVWFDFMTALRYENVSELIDWLYENPIKNDCLFVATYTLHSRNISGEGIRQLFGAGEEKHNEFIHDMGNHIFTALDNDFVTVNEKYKRIRYANLDVNPKAKPMVQYIFNVSKI